MASNAQPKDLSRPIKEPKELSRPIEAVWKGRFEVKTVCREQPKSSKTSEKYINLTAQESIWEHFDALWGLLGTPLTSF